MAREHGQRQVELACSKWFLKSLIKNLTSALGDVEELQALLPTDAPKPLHCHLMIPFSEPHEPETELESDSESSPRKRKCLSVPLSVSK